MEYLRFGEVEVIVKAPGRSEGALSRCSRRTSPSTRDCTSTSFFRELADAECAGLLGPDAYDRASRNYGIRWFESP
jgi:hypothetical protein